MLSPEGEESPKKNKGDGGDQRIKEWARALAVTLWPL